MKNCFSAALISLLALCSCERDRLAPEIKHVDAAGFFEGMKSQSGISLIDTRSEHDYLKGHVKGALNIPIVEIRKGTPKCRGILSRIFNTELYLYCSGSGCDSSSEAAKYLQYCDFKAINVFDGGWQQWVLLYGDDKTGELIERK